MKKMMIMLLTVAALLCGCTQIDKETPGKPRVVERITASYHSDAIELRREYTDDKKMQAVLTYLRTLNPYGTVTEESEAAEYHDARITLHYSDSTTKIYRIYANQYLQINGDQWQNIKEDRGRELPLLLGFMESD